MTTKIAKTFAAVVAAAVIGVSSLATPAMAGGQIAFNYAPTDHDEQQVLGLGLAMFSLFNGMNSTGANVSQHGNNNTAGGSQNGYGNNGVILQDGNGHTGTVNQHGGNNSCGLFQFGENTNAQCDQYGNGQSSLTTVFGF